MKYPKGFPDHLKRHVEGAIAEAEIVFLETMKRASYSEIDQHIYAYILRVFTAFGQQSCQAFEQGAWDGEALRKGMESFLAHLFEHVYFEKHFPPDRYAFNKFYEQSKRAIRQTDEWKALQEEIKRITVEGGPNLRQSQARSSQTPAPEFSECIEKALPRVKGAFQEYRAEVQSRITPNGWANLRSGTPEGFVDCFMPIIRDLVGCIHQQTRSSKSPEVLIMNLIESASFSEPALPTQPWMPKELFENKPFRTRMLTAIRTELARVRPSHQHPSGR